MADVGAQLHSLNPGGHIIDGKATDKQGDTMSMQRDRIEETIWSILYNRLK